MRKIILTEAQKNQKKLEVQKSIIENFATTFNKIKRVDEENINPKGEGGKSDTYFETLSGALEQVRTIANNLGYEVDDEDIWTNYGTGGIPYGQTKQAHIGLLKNGKPILGKSGKPLNRGIRVAILRMDSGRYELTAYKTF